MATLYQERIVTTGSASDKTVYGSKIGAGKVVEIKNLCAYIYTTAVGDYNTAKYVNVGLEVNGVKHYFKGKDVGTGDTVINAPGTIWAKEHDRVFADFEATATTTTYEITVNGKLYDKGEIDPKKLMEE